MKNPLKAFYNYAYHIVRNPDKKAASVAKCLSEKALSLNVNMFSELNSQGSTLTNLLETNDRKDILELMDPRLFTTTLSEPIDARIPFIPTFAEVKQEYFSDDMNAIKHILSAASAESVKATPVKSVPLLKYIEVPSNKKGDSLLTQSSASSPIPNMQEQKPLIMDTSNIWKKDATDLLIPPASYRTK